MRNSAINRFDINLVPEIVRPFLSSKERDRYLAFVQDDCIDGIFVGWLFESGGYFSYLKNRMKKEARTKKLKVAHEIAAAGWPIIVPNILDWMRRLDEPIVVVPVPSRFGSIEALAISLSKMLNGSAPHTFSVNQKLLVRKKELPIKRYNWAVRDQAALAMYALRSKVSIPKNILLVDDVVSSGASLRRCAKLLRDAGAQHVYAAVLAGDPHREENWQS